MKIFITFCGQWHLSRLCLQSPPARENKSKPRVPQKPTLEEAKSRKWHSHRSSILSSSPPAVNQGKRSLMLSVKYLPTLRLELLSIEPVFRSDLPLVMGEIQDKGVRFPLETPWKPRYCISQNWKRECRNYKTQNMGSKFPMKCPIPTRVVTGPETDWPMAGDILLQRLCFGFVIRKACFDVCRSSQRGKAFECPWPCMRLYDKLDSKGYDRM
jgi:hypothetical protein